MDTMTNNVKHQFNSKAEKFGEKAGEKANQAVDRARRAGEEFLETPLVEQLSDTLSSMKTRSVSAYDSTVDSFRRHPALWLGSAIGAGLIAGFFFRRSPSRK